ncbi:sugar phosphate nucleotidyltransferase [Desulfamplus magnetovallimortis]|nr:sugar phosphate nucleotidyltransferase [Desulfamplus magnetovallimortis]
MKFTSVAVIILAAGKGSRMMSDLPKVVHEVHGRSMINRVLDCAVSLFDKKNIVVVIGHKWEQVKKNIDSAYSCQISYALQKNLLGTADAVKCALPYLGDHIKHVLVLCGDVPLIRKETIASFFDHYISNNQELSVLAVDVESPGGYGRIVVDETDNFLAIREEADATFEEKKIQTINAGVYFISKKFLVEALDLIGSDNVQQEYYLTDLVSISRNLRKKAGYFMGNNSAEVMGVNTVDELRRVEHILESGDI